MIALDLGAGGIERRSVLVGRDRTLARAAGHGRLAERARSSVRFSLHRHTTEVEMERAIERRR